MARLTAHANELRTAHSTAILPFKEKQLRRPRGRKERRRHTLAVTADKAACLDDESGGTSDFLDEPFSGTSILARLSLARSTECGKIIFSVPVSITNKLCIYLRFKRKRENLYIQVYGNCSECWCSFSAFP